MRLLVINILLLVFTLPLIAQKSSDLEAKMKKTKSEIAYTNKLLKKTEKSKRKSVYQLELIKKKISLQKQLISSMEEEIIAINNNISDAKKDVTSLNKKLEVLREDYAKMIVYAYRNRSSYERLMYVLASDDFNQAYKRIVYFQQYSRIRKSHEQKIKVSQDSLSSRLVHLNVLVEQKKEAIHKKEEETVAYLLQRKQKSDLVKSLESRRKDLLVQIRKKEKQARKLQDEIQRLIAEERLAAMKENKKPTFERTPEEKLVSQKFNENKGGLPWPTTTGVITEKYGQHPHPILKNIKIQNNGVDITTASNSDARCIFDGVVKKIIVIPGSNATILVRHGEYLTVYSNVINVSVTTGQTVKAKQKLGTVFTDPETGTATMELQIWKETQKLNPELWLTRK